MSSERASGLHVGYVEFRCAGELEELPSKWVNRSKSMFGLAGDSALIGNSARGCRSAWKAELSMLSELFICPNHVY